MNIWKTPYTEYTTDDVMMNKPLFINKLGYLYPVKVKNYNDLFKNVKYLAFNKRFFGIENADITLFEWLITMYIQQKEETMDSIKARETTIKELEDFFSLITHEDIKFIEREDKENNILIENLPFVSKDKKIIIDKNNFDTFRYVVLNQNAIKEAKVYDDAVTSKWMNKAKLAQNKGTDNVTLGDMISRLSVVSGKGYEEILNENILQFRADYNNIVHEKNYDITALFKLVDFGNKISMPNYNTQLEEMYKDNDEDLKIKDNKALNLLSE